MEASFGTWPSPASRRARGLTGRAGGPTAPARRTSASARASRSDTRGTQNFAGLLLVRSRPIMLLPTCSTSIYTVHCSVTCTLLDFFNFSEQEPTHVRTSSYPCLEAAVLSRHESCIPTLEIFFGAFQSPTTVEMRAAARTRGKPALASQRRGAHGRGWRPGPSPIRRGLGARARGPERSLPRSESREA